jgi:hypothetical protein
LILEGTTEKVLQFMMPLKLINNKNLGFIVQKGILEHCRQILAMKNQLIVIIFCHENIFLFTSSELAWDSIKQRCAVPLQHV